jgi:hypothetical protein
MTDSPFSRLDTSLMRSTKTPENQQAESHQASNTASQQKGNTATQQDVKPSSQQYSKPTEKVTYRFHPQGVRAMKEVQWLLLKDHEIEADLAEIAETAILIAHEELLARRQASNIVIRLAGKTASHKKG